jgi:hypothetical protein
VPLIVTADYCVFGNIAYFCRYVEPVKTGIEIASVNRSYASTETLKHAYKTRMLMDYSHRPVFSIDHDVSEIGSVSVLRWM